MTHDLSDLLALDMEYRLTIAVHIDCECAPYLARRREVLIPAVLEQAAKDDVDPVDVFVAFARRVHERHSKGSSRIAGRFAALMGIHPEEPTEENASKETPNDKLEGLSEGKDD